MSYRPDETADYIGLQRITGRLGGRSGSSSVLQTYGTFDGKVAAGARQVRKGPAPASWRGPERERAASRRRGQSRPRSRSSYELG